MQISINLNKSNELSESKRGIFTKIKTSICHASIWNCFMALMVFVILLILLYACKSHTSYVLTWLEKQDAAIIYIVILILFTVVSFPVSVGYIIIVIATGYLFGIVLGLVLTVVGANLGLFIAHHSMKLIGHHSSIRTLVTSETAAAIIKVIAGPLCFKIVVCARLTPIPFGLQNTIFAFSNVCSKVYHIASLIGLLPGQIVGIYVGSSLRSMQDVLDDQQISAFTYLFAIAQLVFAAGLLVWIGSMARRELARAIAEADGKFEIGDNRTGIVLLA